MGYVVGRPGVKTYESLGQSFLQVDRKLECVVNTNGTVVIHEGTRDVPLMKMMTAEKCNSNKSSGKNFHFNF